jgi:hypothetical protein
MGYGKAFCSMVTQEPDANEVLYLQGNSTKQLYLFRKVNTGIAASPSFIFSYDGTLKKVSLQLADTTGGQSYLITTAQVKSQPLTLGAAKTEWVSPIDIITLGIGQTITFQIQLDDICFPPHTLNLTWSATGLGETSSITTHAKNPIITLTAGSQSVNITALSVTSTPYVSQSAFLATAETSSLIILRYGDRGFSLDNSYIYDYTTPQLIADYMIQAFGKIINWLPTLEVMFAPNIQLEDRVTITETNTGVNADYYVVGCSHNLTSGSATTTLVLVKV